MAKRPQQKIRMPRLSMGAWFLVAILLLLALFMGCIELSRPHVDGERLRVDQFLNAVDKGRVREAKILDADAIVIGSYKRPDGSVAAYNAPYFRAEGRQTLANVLLEARVPTTVDQQVAKALLFPALLILVPALIVVLVFVYFILSARRGTGIFAVRSGAKKIEPEESTVSFADVAGQDAAVTDLREVSDFLSKPERFAVVGARMPKGILLFGPPGCGKTLVARALAGEAGAAFFSISGSDFVELYVGVGASRVRDLFREARENAPAIVFIDELDSIAGRRGGGGTIAAASGESSPRDSIEPSSK